MSTSTLLTSTTTGLDVVHLPRIARMLRAFGPTLLARLHHVDDLDSASVAPTPYAVGLTLAVKEAWIKLHGGRPTGWAFPSTGQRLVQANAVPDDIRRHAEVLAVDLELGPLEWVCLTTRRPSPPASLGAGPVSTVWAGAGIRDEWLVAGAFR